MVWCRRFAALRPRLIWSITGAAIAPVIVFAANGLVVLLGLAALAVPTPGRWRDTFMGLARRPIGIALIGLLIWSGVSVGWTPEPAEAAEKIVRLAVLWIAGIAALAAARNAGKPVLAGALWVLPGALLLALGLYWIELAGSASIIRAAGGLANAPLAQIAGAEAREAYRVNLAFNQIGRGAAILSIFIWPVVALLLNRRRGAWLAAALVLATFLTVLALPMAAAVLAFLTGAAGWALCWALPRRGPQLMAGFSMLLLAGLPLAALYVAQPETVGIETRVLPTSWQHRIAIWHFAAGRIAEKPLTGWGFDASRHIEGGKTKYVVLLPDGGALNATSATLLPLHPHNGALQIWLELGAPGALFGLLLLGGLGLAIAAHPATDHSRETRIRTASQAAASASAISLAFLSFGLWQNWWQASFWLAAAAVCLAARAGDMLLVEPQSASGNGVTA